MDLRSLTNIAQSLDLAAEAYPDQVAVAAPRGRSGSRPIPYRTISFADLARQSAQIAVGVREAGVKPGQRISLMIPPGIDFVAWVFGLMKAEATVVLIDPGMGRQNMIRCLREVEPDGLAGIQLAQLIRLWMRRSLPKCRFNFNVGPRWFPVGQSTKGFFRVETNPEIPVVDQHPGKCSSHDRESPAAIIFTTGSTGPPKGVLYRHRHFIEQTTQIRDYFGIEPGGADVSGFPLFALFNTGMGTTTVFPKMDATRPAQIVPLDFIDAVTQFKANQSFGSPALWNTVSRYCEKQKVKLPTLKRVLTAGAPVPRHILERVRKCIADDAEVHTPYGATESLPVACTESREVLEGTWVKTQAGEGICVGRRWPQIRWQIIAISDGPIEQIENAQVLPAGQIGELIVSGPVVTDQYVTRVAANALHKIIDGERFWHRMGDVGYLDDDDRFWFCGRKGHRVQTANGILFTIPCEAIYNNHPQIYRSALVGVGVPGKQIPMIIAEPWPENWTAEHAAQRQLIQQLKDLGERSPLTSQIQEIRLMRALPVDIRHNSKIFREKLAVWAEKQLRTAK